MAENVATATANCPRTSISPGSDLSGFQCRTGSVMSRTSRLSRSSVMALEGDALEDYCKQVFQQCDGDGDGYITEKDMVQQCGEDLQTLECVMQHLDRDNDGRVSFDEFLAGFKVYQNIRKEEDGEEEEEYRMRGSSLTPPTPCRDSKCQLEESIFESDPCALMGVCGWGQVARRIDPDGLLDRSDVASVWAALEQNDPSLLDNFESFLSEVVEELHESQSARETLEHHVKKVLDRHNKEASEFDAMVKQHVCEAEETIILKSAEKSRKLSKRYQSLLAERDALISELSANQATLKKALEERMESEAVLRQEREHLVADNKTLLVKLESSMKQLSEDCEKAPLRCVTSLPDIREMDQSNHYPQEDVNDGPECSTPTSTRTIKSFSIANHVRSCSLNNLFRGDSGGDGGGVGTTEDGTEVLNVTETSASSEPDPQSNGQGHPLPVNAFSSNDSSFVHINSNQCSPMHHAGEDDRTISPGGNKGRVAGSTVGRTSPDGQPVSSSQGTPTCGDPVQRIPPYVRPMRPAPNLYGSDSLQSSGPITYGYREGGGGGLAMVGSGWFTGSSRLPRSSGGLTRVFKVAALGDSGVGKSTLITYLSQGEFRHCTATVGIDFVTKILLIGDERVVFQLWDTAGQEKFCSVTVAHYRRADAFIIVYDVTNIKTFKDVLSWVNVIKAAIRDDSPVVMLIGNKCDRVNERVVSKEDGLRMAAELNAVFAETSAFSGSNVLEAHENLARLLLQKEDDVILATKRLTQPIPSRTKPCAC